MRHARPLAVSLLALACALPVWAYDGQVPGAAVLS